MQRKEEHRGRGERWQGDVVQEKRRGSEERERGEGARRGSEERERGEGERRERGGRAEGERR
eukprot:2298825-Rhodomonas_salina.1